MSRQTKEDIVRLKDEYVEYYTDVPVQKYAAMAIGRTEETVIEWRASDPDFSNRVEKARAAWVKKKAAKVKAEFALERLEKDIWAQRTELTGKDGEPLPAPILGGESKGSDVQKG